MLEAMSGVDRVPVDPPPPPPKPKPAAKTDADLKKVDQAGANLTQAEGQNTAGKATQAQVAAAKANYLAAQQLLVKDLEDELAAARAKIPPSACYAGTPAQQAAELASVTESQAQTQVLAAHGKDPELTTAMAAADIAARVTTAPAGVDQIKALGLQLSSQGTYATQLAGSGANAPQLATKMSQVQELVLSDPSVQKVIKAYVGNAAQQVAQTEKSQGPQAAADQLQQIIVQQLASAIPNNKELRSQLAAQVINASMPTIKQIVGQTNTLVTVTYPTGVASRYEAPSTSPEATNGPQHLDIASDLSQIVDVAAAGGTSSTGQYDSPEITAAVNGVAQTIASTPQAGLQPGLKAAVSNGYATLALATALQTQNLTPAQMSSGSGAPTAPDKFAAWKTATVNSMLGDIKAGLSQFRSNVDSTFTSVANSTPQLAAQSIYSKDLTPAQFNSGVSAMVNGLPASKQGPAVAPINGLKSTIDQGLNTITALGLRVATTDNAVTFYGNTALGKTAGFGGVQQSSDSLISDPNAVAAQMASPQARTLLTAQSWRQTFNGSSPPQYYSIGAQTTGDLVEFLAESYWAKSAATTPGSLLLQDDAGDQVVLDAARVGHSPFALAWASGAAFQGYLTDWLVHNSHPGGPASLIRKSMTIMIVGGFAAMHGGQAGAALARWLSTLSNGSVNLNSTLDKVSRLTVEPTVELIQGLTVLMGLASVSDAAGLTYDITGMQPFGSTTQQVVNSAAVGANLFSDITLFQLQLKGWAQQALGKAVLADAAASKTFQQTFTYAMYDALGQPQLVPEGAQPSATLIETAKAVLQKEASTPAGKQQVAAKILAFRQLVQEQAAAAKAPPAARAGMFTRVWNSIKSLFSRGKSAADTPTAAQAAADPVDAFLADSELDYANTVGKLSVTSQRTLATRWALEDNAKVASSLSETLAKLSQNRYLDWLTDKLGPKVASALGKGGSSSAATTEDLATLLGGDAIDTTTEEGTAAATDAIIAAVGTSAAGDVIPIIGWIVNGIYLTTTVGTTLFNQYEKMKQSDQAQYAFLRGAGFDDAHANALSQHGFWEDSSASTGLATAYHDLGGNSADFVKYVNSMPIPTLDTTLAAVSATPNGGSLPAKAQGDYWTLPVNPADAAQRKFSPDVTYNSNTHTWIDAALGVSFENGEWVKKGVTMTNGIVTAGTYYDPTSEELITEPDQPMSARFRSPPTVVNEKPTSQAGLDTWFLSNGVPLPPENS